MPRAVFIWCPIQGKVVPKGEETRPDVDAPFVQGDSTDGFLSHADGRIYESKSAYRRALKERGYIEVGSESIQDRRESIWNAEKKARREAVADIVRDYYVR